MEVYYNMVAYIESTITTVRKTREDKKVGMRYNKNTSVNNEFPYYLNF